MSKSYWWSLVAVALALQGCASDGGIKYAPGAAPTQTTHAGTSSTPVVTAIHSKTDFAAVRAAIAQQMQAGGRFASVSSEGRATVDGRFQDMSSLFEQYGTFDNMTPIAREKINDDQNAINGVLAQYDGNRLVCHDEYPVGSHLPKRICRTLTQIRNEQNDAGEMMRRMQSNGSSNMMNGGH